MILLQKITGSARGGDLRCSDYTLYRKGWEIGDGVHIATGNYTKSFTDLSVTSPGVTSDFVRTYNSTSNEEGSFGIGWDFNIDVSKIVKPAAGYYQVVLPMARTLHLRIMEKVDLSA